MNNLTSIWILGCFIQKQNNLVQMFYNFGKSCFFSFFCVWKPQVTVEYFFLLIYCMVQSFDFKVEIVCNTEWFWSGWQEQVGLVVGQAHLARPKMGKWTIVDEFIWDASYILESWLCTRAHMWKSTMKMLSRKQTCQNNAAKYLVTDCRIICLV